MNAILENKKYQAILQENDDNLSIWSDRINDYRTNALAYPDTDELKKFIFEITDYLHEILQIFIRFGKFKDKFITPTIDINYEGLEAQIVSEKTNHSFQFGFDFQGLYIRSYISHADYLKNVPDSFWESVLELSQYGEFKFEENGVFNIEVRRKYPHLFKPTKSNVFKLTRNFFLNELLRKDDYRYSPHADLGWFCVRWSPETYSIEEVLVMGCEAFRILYHLNLMLWKLAKPQ